MSGVDFLKLNSGYLPAQMPPMSFTGLTPADTGNIFWQPVMQAPQIDFSALAKMQEQYIQMQKTMLENMAKTMANMKLPRINIPGYQPVDAYYSDFDTQNCSYDATELKEKWSKKKPHLSDGFYNKVVAISKRVGCSPDALMAVMNSESGIKAYEVNKKGGATGLIQFMPETAKDLGTSTSALMRMSPEEQLVYVEKFLLNAKKSAGFAKEAKIDAGTLYSLVYLPAYANRTVLSSQGHKYYDKNTGLDVNKDGYITKADLAQRLQQFSA